MTLQKSANKKILPTENITFCQQMYFNKFTFALSTNYFFQNRMQTVKHSF